MADLADIQMLVMDVDGVLTDGTIIINGDGSESKFFNSLDGHGIRILSVRASQPEPTASRTLTTLHGL